MGKQLKFTKEEQKGIPELINALGSILLGKMDEGVTAPKITGTINVKGENRVVVFNIEAHSKG